MLSIRKMGFLQQQQQSHSQAVLSGRELSFSLQRYEGHLHYN